MDPYIGEIRIFGGNFAPLHWAFCKGQLLPISGNDALFALIGTTYGGDGVNTFALPDLQGRAPVHQGSGPGLSNYVLGQKAGEESVTLTAQQIPPHTHTVAYGGAGGQASPQGGLLGTTSARDFRYSDAGTDVSSSSDALRVQGASDQPHENRSPFLAVNFIICLSGIFPARN